MLLFACVFVCALWWKTLTNLLISSGSSWLVFPDGVLPTHEAEPRANSSCKQSEHPANMVADQRFEMEILSRQAIMCGQPVETLEIR